MSRPSTFVWFGRPTPGSSTSTSTSNTSSSCHHKIVGLRELAVVFEDIPTYRRYKPGNGPRLAPITLLPVRDTTAYIRDEFFVPPALSVDGKKRLQYVVGWTDLPAARLQVDAERICEYVSPMAYEEWCAARAAERDEEERRFEKEENMRVLESEARGPRIARNGVEGPKGRKRKHSVAVKTRTTLPSTKPPDANGGKKKPGRPRKDAPSLSTPSKSKISEDFEGLDVEGDVEMEEALFRQLNGEEQMSTEGSFDSGERSNVPARLEPSAKKRRTKSPRPTLSRLISGIETDSSRSTPFDSSRGGTSSPALPPLPQPGAVSRPARPQETPILPPVPPASALQASTPTAPRTKTQLQKRSLLSIRHPSSTPQKPSLKAQTPTPKSAKVLSPATAPPTINPPMNGAETIHTPTPRTSFTPLIQCTTPWTISLAASLTSSKGVTKLTPSQPIQSIEQASFLTPKSKLPKPAIRDRNSSLKASYSAPPATTAGSKQAVAKILPAQGGQQAPEDDNIYEVLRLEGVQERIVRGKRVRFFHVRWKGTWPPDQNPTWEPEANIPRSLIKKYLLAHPQQQKQKQQGHKTSAMDKYLVPSWPHRKYSSVSEAFEGGDTDDAAGGDGNDDDEEAVEDGDAEEDNGDEMLLVTDEPS
ncbi:chromo domain-containing protein [Colletotrichum incanum]|uniref:Chromo domain-containing protein n=1 Tax=Colletotrichum incanum TaxID=1573173 RepID=A0A166PYR5_COLIC|nr:chromo domain-containing protein [Colletotrichum incanum]